MRSSPGCPPPAEGLERLVASDTVDWFPHLSPDGDYARYISFPTGTLGTPPTSMSRSAWSDDGLDEAAPA